MSTTSHADSSRRMRRTRIRRWLVGVAVVAVIGTGGFAVVESQRGTPSSGPAGVAVAAVPDLGEVLVDGQGKALYLFEPDAAASVTCTAGCADKWPPLTVSDGAPDLGPGVPAELVGRIAGEDGVDVVTYAGWPLYRYESDDPGEATGHGDDDNGGVWRAVTPDGKPAA